MSRMIFVRLEGDDDAVYKLTILFYEFSIYDAAFYYIVVASDGKEDTEA
jgi:hypothetical protein